MIKSLGQKAQEPKTLVFTSKCFFPSLFWQLNSSFSFYRASACWAPIKHERNDVWLETESVFCSLAFCCVALHRVEIIESTWWASFASRKNKWLATGEQLNEINAASEKATSALLMKCIGDVSRRYWRPMSVMQWNCYNFRLWQVIWASSNARQKTRRLTRIITERVFILKLWHYESISVRRRRRRKEKMFRRNWGQIEIRHERDVWKQQ